VRPNAKWAIANPFIAEALSRNKSAFEQGRRAERMVAATLGPENRDIRPAPLPRLPLPWERG